MEIKINSKKYKVEKGETVLDVCRREEIKIPSLCSFEGLKKEAVCRLCLVEIEGKLATSCSTEVMAGLEVVTENENIQKARRINLELLWSDHAGKCATCEKNRMCELQTLAEEYKIENFHFVPRKEEMSGKEELDLVRDNWSRVVTENENPCILRDNQFCVECRRCINICPEKKFGFNHRAGDVVVGTAYNEILDCSFCGKCVEACPTASLTDKNDFSKIIESLDDLRKFSIAVIDFDMKDKIKEKIAKISREKDLEKIFFSLGFEKIINLEKEDKDKEDEVIKNIKTEYAASEKIGVKNIKIFFISSKIYKKAQKNKYLDYVLSEAEVARLVRDKKKKTEGKMK